MRAPLEQIILGLEARDARIGRLYIEQRAPALAEFHKLKAILRKHALEKRDYQTLEWIDEEQAKLDSEFEQVSDELLKSENREMSIRHHDLTDEEIIAHWKHVDAISEVAERKLELHIKYIQDLSVRLKAKIADIAQGDT